ncbi:Similar to Probable tRNA(Ile)-lysidine synthase; acc. no. Q10441 [Pyronema omphalodes CBS 100304]|uniref:tRNA(Ile)-lysidine synthetase n=1 Tax=Pyronema omphalodes (strain CBS 100304) TaxID=1076935 RepID=U4LE46_PYROM|nr:Similar to Probable tRNA(Ile)-lysidine synthase; acc. no. Q10441 [Pyronema omphalodes CBS 100304]
MSFRKLVSVVLHKQGAKWGHMIVGAEEFRSRFFALWRYFPPRIGIAVSGGVDSMALAHLTKTLASEERMAVHCFIVDHGARPGSAREAAKVAAILESYRFHAHVLKLQWPEGLPSSAFETKARIARYRAIAEKCVQHDIRHVLLGHHSDDLAETVLMRMIQSSRAEGLRGMKKISRIPECQGIYGAEEIQLGRPLLAISKIRLKRTCREESVQWFEDPTNNDPSFTLRNSIRTLLFSRSTRKSLPLALQKPQLISLVDRLTDTERFTTLKAEKIIAASSVSLEVRTGTLTFKLPVPNDATLDYFQTSTDARIMLKALTLLTEKVTPNEKINRRTMLGVLAKIFNGSKAPAMFSAGGLTWSRDPNGLFTLRRSPHFTRTRLAATLDIPVSTKSWTKWILWDGRYWIRLRSNVESVEGVIIRPLAPIDMAQLRDRLEQLGWEGKVVVAHLKALEGNHLWTVPVIALRPPERGELGGARGPADGRREGEREDEKEDGEEGVERKDGEEGDKKERNKDEKHEDVGPRGQGYRHSDGVDRRWRERSLVGLPTFGTHLMNRVGMARPERKPVVDWEISFRRPI